MNVETFLNELRKLGVQLQLAGTQLKINAPTGVLTPEYIERIRENRTAIVTYLQKLSNESYRPIPRIADRDSYPVSNAQKRLWLLSHLGEQSVAYNIPSLYTLTGNLDTVALSAAFRILSARHESLRTVFNRNSDEPAQRILPASESAIEIVLRDFTKEQRPQEAAYNHAIQLLKCSFNLETGPLVTVELLKTGTLEHLLVCSMHHIISDEWSVGVIVREINSIYNTLIAGKEVNLPPLSIQYRDYTIWQEQELQSVGLKAARDYWLSRFSGELPLLEIPADYRRPAMQQHNGATLRWQFPSTESNDFRNLLQQHQATLFMGVMSLVDILLYRYTGQTDIIVGSPVAGRDHPDLEDQIGFYVNTLAFRNQIADTDSFIKVLSNVRSNTIDAFSHQAYPFDLLVDELELKRDLSRSPLFDVMVVWQNTSHSEASGISLSGITAERLHLQEIVSKFDLSFYFEKNTNGLQVLIEYNTDIYRKERVENIARHLEALMKAAISQPTSPVATLDYLSTAERRQLIETFNLTVRKWPAPAKNLVTCFEEQAKLRGGETAVVTGDRILSYQELNNRASQLASRLKNVHNINGNELIGISTDRNEYLLIGILGILKAGGAYVPIDPDYPEDRICYIIENSRLRLILTDKEITQEPDGVELICIPRELENGYAELQNSNAFPGGEDIAYVIYTSGSTGKPKGVQVRHASAVNVLYSVADKLQLTPSDRWVAITTYTFDMSVVEMFAPLLSGGCVILAGKEEASDPDVLASLLEVHEATVLQATPGMWNVLIESGWKGRRELQVISGGEAMSETLISRLLTLAGRVWNMYGPTETTVYSTALELTSVSQVNLIGRPIANTQVYIVDERLQPQPVGVPGELCIGGEGVAAGYLNNAALTADRFIPNPYGPGQLYRTGDIARWHNTGEIEYHGRRDNQVKIRGYRIELGEIESVLMSSGLVTQAIVIVVGEGIEKALAAYYVTERDTSVSLLRSYLQSKLPQYMVPVHFMELPEFPLTSNGKIDRKALPQPQQQTHTYRAPATETEQLLAGIWESVLNRDQIGLDDNFFDIGGNSLKAMQVISRIFREHSIKLGIRDLFSNPVLSQFVEKVEIMMWINDPITSDLSSNTDEIIL